MRNTLIALLDRIFCWLYGESPSIPGEPQYRIWRANGRWNYTLVAGNNEPMSTSTQSHPNKSALLRAIGQHRRNAAIATVAEVGAAPVE